MTLKAPFPWFGGKRLVAPLVWERLGDPAVYCEPFAGSMATLLNRPEHQWRDGRIETVNDLDGYLSNAWRAILHDPDATAHHADWPSIENDLHARNAWLTERRESFRARVEGDPEWYDTKVAGWWLWGMSQWIGGGFASQSGPWAQQEQEDGSRQLVRLGNAGQGVKRQLVHLGDAGRGVSRQLVHLNAGMGVSRRSAAGGLVEWLRALSERLRRVRVASGDWSRVVTPSAMAPGINGVRGVFLDPPYSADRNACYSEESFDVAHNVREWCMTAPKDWRIALCGYDTEHDALLDAGWTVEAWKAHGGLQHDKSGGNRFLERVWFSPACLTRTQREMFG